MTQPTASLTEEHFDAIYARSPDPWNFRKSRYERAKYAATLAALPPRRFRAALEVGCSIGELTYLLAARCDAVNGLDIAAAPLAIAQRRCNKMPHVRFAQMSVPRQWPVGQYDLIVLSEVLYFLSEADIQTVAAKVCASLAGNGIVLLVNWLGDGNDPTNGERAAEIFLAATETALKITHQDRTSDYRIDRLTC